MPDSFARVCLLSYSLRMTVTAQSFTKRSHEDKCGQIVVPIEMFPSLANLQVAKVEVTPKWQIAAGCGNLG